MIKLTGDKYLVTGGAGFIGSHICEEIVKQGKKVVCLDNLVAGKIDNLRPWWNPILCTFVSADVTDDNIDQYFRDVDIVFHNAASKCTVCREDPLLDLMSNAYGSFNIFTKAIKNNVKKVVHASTGSVKGLKPQSFYGVSKSTAEMYLNALRDYYQEFRYTILRYYHVYGSRQNDSDTGGVIPIFINQVYHKKPIVIYDDGLQVRHFTYVKDIVESNFAVAESQESDSKIYTAVSDVTMSIYGVAGLIQTLMDTEVDIIYKDRRAGDIRTFSGLNNTKLKELGVKFNIPFAQGLLETINWYKDKYDNS